eukprot:SAG31_NODE_13996_length_833_cov_0.656676_1_plen_107_part_00
MGLWAVMGSKALALAALATAAATTRQPLQLCRCAVPGTRAAEQQTWDWGARSTVDAQTAAAPIRLRSNHSLCLHAGAVPGRAEAQALYVADCASAPNLSFVPTMKR